MYVSTHKIEEAIELFRENEGVMRTSDVLGGGVHRRTLYYMRDEGIINPIERGVYQLKEKEPLSNPDLVIVAKKIPEARVCLISALALHEMTDEIPHEVHIALPRSSWKPRISFPPLKVYHFSEETLIAGVEEIQIDGIGVKVFNPAKTIADCFKFRNKIGIPVAIEALKRGVEERKASFADIKKYAKICKVENIIMPYLETIAHD